MLLLSPMLDQYSEYNALKEQLKAFDWDTVIYDSSTDSGKAVTAEALGAL